MTGGARRTYTPVLGSSWAVRGREKIVWWSSDWLVLGRNGQTGKPVDRNLHQAGEVACMSRLYQAYTVALLVTSLLDLRVL